MPLSKAWYVGNTTIRSPYRLKGALFELSSSNLLRNLDGIDNQNAFARLLHDTGIARLSRLEEDPAANVSDLGRKWQSALVQMGFITPDGTLLNNLGLQNSQFDITPNGWRLIQSQTLAEENDCFLRSILALQIPSPVEPFVRGVCVFNPLRVVLRIMHELEVAGLEPIIDKNEMACIVQLTGDDSMVAESIGLICQYRAAESAISIAIDRKRFRREYRDQVASRPSCQNAETLIDYADTNFRYLRWTGLFANAGDGIVVAPHRRRVVAQILDHPFEVLDSSAYLQRFWQGAVLPFDNTLQAIDAIELLAALIAEQEEPVDIPRLEGLSIQDLAQIRIRLEERLRQLREERFADTQAGEWQNITEYLTALSAGTRGAGHLIPGGEAPAFLEWAVWRAFLAIDSLVNSPWEARRFRIDQDFMPISTAPGNNPDMEFEFEDFVLVVEVTLTTSSRQEAAEGAPVRRHVAERAMHYTNSGKRVYGLFIANTIDTNTAETFRIGSWYGANDSRLALRIVPLTIAQFRDLFATGFGSAGRLEPSLVENLLMRCRAESNLEAPAWKSAITDELVRVVRHLQE